MSADRHQQPRIACRLLTVAITAALLLSAGQRASADTLLASLPAAGQKGTGFSLSVWAGESLQVGLCLVKVRFRATGPTFGADRTLTIELQPRGRTSHQSTFDFRQKITLQQNDRVHQEILEVPIYYPWATCQVRLLEDGAVLSDYDSRNLAPVFLNTDPPREMTITIIESRTVDTDPPAWQKFPDIRSLIQFQGQAIQNGNTFRPRQLSNADARRLVDLPQRSTFNFNTFHEDRLPIRWTHYNSTNVVLVSVPTLQRIASENPIALESLRKWIASGGVLWCYGDKGVEPLSALLYMSTPWDTVSLRDSFSVNPTSKPTPPVRLMSQRMLAGKVLFLDREYPFPGSLAIWLRVIADSSNWLPMQNRLGMNIVDGDNNFWNWLIGEVGQPPVYTFLFMISLFVLLVGPVSYYFFLYIKRLYLFFVFAPLVALVCTACIGLYALFADGFGSRMRARQLTLISANGDAVSWSRQTYFSGLRPRDGVGWDRDTAVFPLKEWKSDRSDAPTMESELPAGSQVVVDETKMRLTGGFMPSRAQAQFLTIAPALGVGPVVAHRDGSSVRVENQTPYHLQAVLLADRRSRYWMARDVASKSSVDAVAIDPVDVSRWMTTTYMDSAPGLPAGYQDASQSALLRMSSQRNIRRRRMAPSFSTSNDGGLVEAMFRTMMVEQGVPQFGQFVATGDLPAETIGIDGAKPVECVHLLMGEFRFAAETESTPAVLGPSDSTTDQQEQAK